MPIIFDPILLGMRLEPHDLFDSEYYGLQAEEFGHSFNDAWVHFTENGRKEHLDPCPWFDSKWYINTYELPDHFNAFIHFCTIGCFYGASPNESIRSNILDKIAKIFVQQGASQSLNDIPARLLFSSEHDSQWRTLHTRWYTEEYLPLININISCMEHYAAIGSRLGIPTEPEIERIASQRKEQNSLTIFDHIGQYFYNQHFVRQHYRKRGPEETYNNYFETAYFDGVFPNLSTCLYTHFLCKKHYPSLYKNRLNLSSVLGLSNEDRCEEDIRITIDLAMEESSSSFHQIDKVFSNDCFQPGLHIFSKKNSYGVYLNNDDDVSDKVSKIKASTYFDAEEYLEANNIDVDSDNAALHYLLVGNMMGYSPSSKFDHKFYVRTYPDIAALGEIPFLHYEDYGEQEGRLSLGSNDIEVLKGTKPYDSSKNSILLFTHESSLTGAPIVLLNICKKLSKNHNIFVWAGKSGELIEDFIDESVEIFIGWGHEWPFRKEIERLKTEYQIEITLVNSIVCYPVLDRLSFSGLPIIFLIHEFANYVYPKGTVSRAIFNADLVYSPAAVIENSIKEELSNFGVTQYPENLSIAHQGYNRTEGRTADIDKSEILSILGFQDTTKPRRIVLGAGQVNPRKGVDLFVLTAKEIIKTDQNTDWRFIWVGGGYEPTTDFELSLYLKYMIENNDLQDKLFMFDHQNSLQPFFDIADLFFLSSKLDPFPNVVLDALSEKLPVVCFEQATGFDEYITEFPELIIAASYCDISDAAKKIIDCAHSSTNKGKRISKSKFASLSKRFSFDSYVSKIVTSFEDAKKNYQKREDLTHSLQNLSLRDCRSLAFLLPEFMLRPYNRFDHEEYVFRISGFLSRYDRIPFLADETLVPIVAEHPVCGASYEDTAWGAPAKSISMFFYCTNLNDVKELMEQFDISELEISIGFQQSKDQTQFSSLTNTDNFSVYDQTFASVLDFSTYIADIIPTPLFILIDGTKGISTYITSHHTSMVLGRLTNRFYNYFEKNQSTKSIIPMSMSVANCNNFAGDFSALTGCFRTDFFKEQLGAVAKVQKKNKSKASCSFWQPGSNTSVSNDVVLLPPIWMT